MKKIALIHFLPLEYYPPVTNMINYLAEELNTNVALSVFSTHNTKDRAVFNNIKVKIHRTAQSEGDRNKLIRLLKYIYFQLFVLLKLIIVRPEKILYYESLSSFPVYVYRKIINRKTKIYIHYHEYTTPEQYATHSMAIERYFHKLEQKFIYKTAVWISHTNKDRLKMFFKDNSNINENILKEMPNYPPKSWTKLISVKNQKDKSSLKCVYIGSLSLESTYIKEFVNWVLEQKGKVSFDIFAYNLHEDTLIFLNKINSPHINFNNNGIEYDNIPLILNKYDVGIVFYKPYSYNVINCVSNKFFEYYACGLDIWFSKVMQSTMQYVTMKNRPLITPVDFTKIDEFDWRSHRSIQPEVNKNIDYFCENVYNIIKNEFGK